MITYHLEKISTQQLSVFQPLQIKSVMCKEGLKGYVYIEAYKQTHVKQAIEGVSSLRIGRWKQQVGA